jgi:hypothetical protein
MGFVRFFALVCLAPAFAHAQTWSGYLVDSKCYADLERNHNPQSTLMDVNTDRGSEIRYCRPKPKTTSFAVVDHDGQSVNLDASGNTQAAALARSHVLRVTMTGKLRGRTLAVETITPAK